MSLINCMVFYMYMYMYMCSLHAEMHVYMYMYYACIIPSIVLLYHIVRECDSPYTSRVHNLRVGNRSVLIRPYISTLHIK